MEVLTAREIAKRVGISQSNVSYFTRTLGVKPVLIRSTRGGPRYFYDPQVVDLIVERRKSYYKAKEELKAKRVQKEIQGVTRFSDYGMRFMSIGKETWVNVDDVAEKIKAIQELIPEIQKPT